MKGRLAVLLPSVVVMAVLVLVALLMLRYQPGAPQGAVPTELLHELQGFVERERGRAFVAPPKVALMYGEPYETRAAKLRGWDKKVVEQAPMLHALGLLSREDLLDARRKAEHFRASASHVLYDEETKEVIVRRPPPPVYPRSDIVEGLTIALEDQHFDISQIGRAHV